MVFQDKFDTEDPQFEKSWQTLFTKQNVQHVKIFINALGILKKVNIY